MKSYRKLLNIIISQKMQEDHGITDLCEEEFIVYEYTSGIDFVIVYYEDHGEEKTTIFQVDLYNGIYEEKTFDDHVTELYYGINGEFYTRQDVFNEWKEYLEEEDETFLDFLRYATDKNGELDRII